MKPNPNFIAAAIRITRAARSNLAIRAIRPLLLLLWPAALHAQIDWNNYSTSFQGIGKEGKRPTLVTAIPYNGIYDGASYGSIPSSQVSIADTLREAIGSRSPYIGVSHTIDSGDVYFLAPGTHPGNGDRYEWRALLDGRTVLHPWGPVTQFSAPGFNVNDFLPNFGFLGGFHAPWGHAILVDLREKATGHILSSALVWWTNRRPSLLGVYTISDLPSFMAAKRQYGSWQPDSTAIRRLTLLRDGTLHLPRNDNTLIGYVGAEIYRRTALEYSLLRDGQTCLPWQPNQFDNNLIFLRDLPKGQYTLLLRFRTQRHNVSTFRFTVEPGWYETKTFRLLEGAAATVGIGGLILLFFFLRQRRRARRDKAAREQVQLELRAIRAQLNPHFVFNALGSIQGLINRGDTAAANRYLTGFANLLREALASSRQDTTQLSRETAVLDNYLQLEQLRFGFRYTIDTAPDLPPDTEIPAFLLQPLVENAVKHGVSGLREQGQIRILFSRENANFIVQVTDNGKGWDPARPQTEGQTEAQTEGQTERRAEAQTERRAEAQTEGYGLKLTRERIRLLNQLRKDRPAGLTLASEPGKGSTITLHFSNWWL